MYILLWRVGLLALCEKMNGLQTTLLLPLAPTNGFQDPDGSCVHCLESCSLFSKGMYLDCGHIYEARAKASKQHQVR